MADNSHAQQELKHFEREVNNNNESLAKIKEDFANFQGFFSNIVAQLNKLSAKMQEISQYQQSQISGENPNPRNLQKDSIGSQIKPFTTRIDFPKFNGNGFRKWLFKCNCFFDLDETPENAKLKWISMHLEGNAMNWHRCYVKSNANDNSPIVWEQYIADMKARFDEELQADPMFDFKSLRQCGSVMEHLEKFEELLCKLDVEMNESLIVSCFLAGLTNEIKYSVRIFNPKTLCEAMRLARLQENVFEAIYQERLN